MISARAESVTNFITGSIYKIALDASHPSGLWIWRYLFFTKARAAPLTSLWKKGTMWGILMETQKVFPVFLETDAKAKLKNSMVFGEARMGSGSVVYLVDDVLFRSFWEQGKLFFANALFFVNNNKFTL